MAADFRDLLHADDPPAAAAEFKEHAATIAAVKKGDEVVTGGGIRGRVDQGDGRRDVEVEIGQGVKVRIVKATLSHVVRPNTKPAND